MKYIGENAIKKLISLIKGDLAKKQDSITVSGLLKGDGTNISAAVAGTDYVAPNGDGSNVTVTFSTLDKLNLVSGDSLSRLMGKISAWLKDLGKLAFKNTVAKTDLASDVQTSLGKADSALQSYTETDPTVPAWAKSETKPTYTASEVGAVPTSRTVNGKALSANIMLAASDVGAATMNEVNSAIQTAIGNAIGGSY